MEKKTARLVKWVLSIFSFTALLIFSIIFYAVFLSSRARIQNQNQYNTSDNSLYHVIITGSYENQSFLSEVYKGASKLAPTYKTTVDLHVPKSQAGTESIQSLLDYCSFLNADGIIIVCSYRAHDGGMDEFNKIIDEIKDLKYSVKEKYKNNEALIVIKKESLK